MAADSTSTAPATANPAPAATSSGNVSPEFMQRMKVINERKTKCALDSAELTSVKGELEAVKTEYSEYKVKTRELIVKKNKSIDSLNKSIDSLKTAHTAELSTKQAKLDEALKKQSPIAALTSPSGCAVLIVLILCITFIAMKKGLRISKGNTNVSIGEGESKK